MIRCNKPPINQPLSLTNFVSATYPGPHWDTTFLPFTGSFSRTIFFVNHFFVSVWNYSEVRKLLPSATFVTLLRDPVDCWESNYVYMGLQNAFKMDINEFAASERVRKKCKLGSKIIC